MKEVTIQMVENIDPNGELDDIDRKMKAVTSELADMPNVRAVILMVAEEIGEGVARIHTFVRGNGLHKEHLDEIFKEGCEHFLTHGEERTDEEAEEGLFPSNFFMG